MKCSLLLLSLILNVFKNINTVPSKRYIAPNELKKHLKNGQSIIYRNNRWRGEIVLQNKRHGAAPGGTAERRPRSISPQSSVRWIKSNQMRFLLAFLR